jgi:hypothetical protein
MHPFYCDNDYEPVDRHLSESFIRLEAEAGGMVREATMDERRFACGFPPFSDLDGCIYPFAFGDRCFFVARTWAFHIPTDFDVFMAGDGAEAASGLRLVWIPRDEE